MTKKTKPLEDTGLPLENKLSYLLLLSLGGTMGMAVGGYHLWELASTADRFSTLCLGIFFLSLGLFAWISLLDQQKLRLYKDRIVVTSLFRQRIFRKTAIEAYGVEQYQARGKERERLIIFAEGQSCKLLSEQFVDLSDIKNFLRGKPKKADAFRKDNKKTMIFAILSSMLLLASIARDICTASNSGNDTEELTSIGIPFSYQEDFSLLSEEAKHLRFRLRGYEHFVFTVTKQALPSNFSTVQESLVLFVDDSMMVRRLALSPDSLAALPGPLEIEGSEITLLK